MRENQLSIVIVEYRCAEEIEGCLRSLKQHLGDLSWECIVVSNSEYSDVDLAQVRKRLAGARVIANDCNRGYAGGVNRALPECNAPFVFIMNPDCRLTDERIPELIAFMTQNPDIAVVGPKVTDEQGEVQPSCRRFPYPWTFLLVRSALRHLPGATKERRRYLMEDFDHYVERDADWVSGGAMMVRKSAIEDVGPMDERFFLYMEAVDWCRRFWEAGWRVRYVPACTVQHAGRHASLHVGVRRFTTPHSRLHLVSLAKYFLKHGLRRYAATRP